MKKILVVTPHPDDQTLGCGGTLLLHKKNKDKIYWINFTSMFKNDGFSIKTISRRNKEIKKILKTYKFDKFIDLGYRTKFLDLVARDELISRLSMEVNKIKPNTIYIPYWFDRHTDHQIVSNVSLTLTKSFRFSYIKKIYAYEIVSETNLQYDSNFIPNSYVDITSTIKKKLNVLKIYRSEIKKHPFPRSKEVIYSQAIIRGSESGFKFAEAFHLVKETK